MAKVPKFALCLGLCLLLLSLTLATYIRVAAPYYGRGKFFGKIGKFGTLGYKGYYRPIFYRPYPFKYGFGYGYPYTFLY